MSKINASVVREAEEFVSGFLEEKLPEDIIFHRFEHAEDILKNVEIIGKHCELDDEEMNVVRISALFHDVGYVFQDIDHEIRSAEIAREFLSSKEVDNVQVKKVEQCILATKVPQNPQDKISKVLCDADLMHFSTEEYFEKAEKLRKEWKKTGLHDFNKKAFDLNSVEFFKNHRYHTEYGKTILEEKKKKIMEQLMDNIKIRDKKKGKNEGKKNKKKKKDKGYSRGVESMFRLTARNQISLSSIADNKSNILISVNAIILSVVVSLLVRKWDETPQIIIPTLIFLTSCLITIVFAILSTIPNISSGKFTKDDIKKNKVNLLFFGNFYKMDYEEYEWAVGELMKNDEFLYSTMIKDQYSLGKVLAKKYKLLRKAYNIFMYGIIISVIAFVLSFVNF